MNLFLYNINKIILQFFFILLIIIFFIFIR